MDKSAASPKMRRLLGSPAYRLGATSRRRRVIGAAIWLVVIGGILGGTAAPLMPFSTLDMDSLGALLLMALGQVVGIPIMLIGVGMHGALTFAPERRLGTADQFVLLPLPTREKFLARALAAAMPMLPALAVAALVEVTIAARFASQNSDRDVLVFAVAWVATAFTATITSFSAGLWASLRAKTAGRAIGLALLFAILAMALAVGLFAVAGLIFDRLQYDEAVAAFVIVLAAIAYIAPTGTTAVLMLRSCVRHMDEWLLREC